MVRSAFGSSAAFHGPGLWRSPTATIRSYSSKGRPRRTTASTTEKIAVLAPMPSVSTSNATIVKVLDEPRARNAAFRSSRMTLLFLEGEERRSRYLVRPVGRTNAKLVGGGGKRRDGKAADVLKARTRCRRERHRRLGHCLPVAQQLRRDLHVAQIAVQREIERQLARRGLLDRRTEGRIEQRAPYVKRRVGD